MAKVRGHLIQSLKKSIEFIGASQISFVPFGKQVRAKTGPSNGS